MAHSIYLIVEGDGETKAAPLLVRRILHEQFQHFEFSLQTYNAHGHGNITVAGGLERFLELPRRQPDCVGVILILDVERENVQCPPNLACSLGRRAQSLGLRFPVAVVCAACEWESWFLYSPKVAQEYLKLGVRFQDDPEKECSAREWLKQHMRENIHYKETQDQPRMTAYLEIEKIVTQSRSLRRCVDAIEWLLQAIKSETADVSPLCEDMS